MGEGEHPLQWALPDVIIWGHSPLQYSTTATTYGFLSTTIPLVAVCGTSLIFEKLKHFRIEKSQFGRIPARIKSNC